jgi:D-aminoacyl-tRNA deacylase
VSVDGTVCGSIETGLLLLVAFRETDDTAILRWMARKCAELRIFRDDESKMNRSLRDVGGKLLVVSQFTLYGDARKGRRPSFVASAPGPVAERLYEEFLDICRGEELAVEAGVFGANMSVRLANDGPVTLILDRDQEV